MSKYLPNIDDWYYIPSPFNENLYEELQWKGDIFDLRNYNLGIVFKDKDLAIELSQKMLSVVNNI